MEIMCLGNGRASQMMGVQGTSNDSEKGGWGWVLTIVEYYSKRSELFRGRNSNYFVALVQSVSHVWLFAIPLTAACQVSLSFTISQNLLRLMSIRSVMPSNHLLLCCPLLLLPLIFPQGLFQWVGSSHQGAKILGTISPSSEYSRLISFRIDWFDLLARESKGLSRSLLQHHNSKVLSLLYGPILISNMTTGETIALVFH